MNYATKYQLGNNKASQKSTTTEFTRPDRTVRGMDGKTKGLSRSTKGQGKICTDSDASNGFLRNSFSPRLEENETVKGCRNLSNMERDFFKSLSLIVELYGLEIKSTETLGYPDNIRLALNDVREQLKENETVDWKEIRLVHHEGSVFFAKVESFCTSRTLYYIPVITIYDLLNDLESRNSAELLLSIYSYLYHIADIPYYRQEDTYLFSTYDIIDELKKEEESEDKEGAREIDEEFLFESQHAKDVGDLIEQKLLDLIHLNEFQDRFQKFQCKNEQDVTLRELAGRFLQLYVNYPDTPLHRNIRINEDFEEEDEFIVRFRSYVSFSATIEGDLFDRVFETVNTDFLESCLTEEPVIFIPLDGREIQGNNFDFEKELFPLLNELVCLLEDY